MSSALTDVIVVLMFMELSGLMAVWAFVEHVKAWEKNNSKIRVKSDKV